jgi:hypothetical protein
MSHGGPLTAVQKKLRDMAASSAQRPTGPQAPLPPVVYDYSSSTSTSPHAVANEPPLISYGDIEMEDAVPTSPANYVSILFTSSQHQLTFSVIYSLTSTPSRPFLLLRNLSSLLALWLPFRLQSESPLLIALVKTSSLPSLQPLQFRPLPVLLLLSRQSLPLRPLSV